MAVKKKTAKKTAKKKAVAKAVKRPTTKAETYTYIADKTGLTKKLQDWLRSINDIPLKNIQDETNLILQN